MKITRVGNRVSVDVFAIKDLQDALKKEHPDFSLQSVESIDKTLWWYSVTVPFNWYKEKARYFKIVGSAYNMHIDEIIKLPSGRNEPNTNYSYGDAPADIERKLCLRLILIRDLLNEKLTEMKKNQKQFDFEIETNIFDSSK